MSRGRPGPALLTLALALGLAILFVSTVPARPAERSFTLASSNTTDDSGLFAFLLPRFMTKAEMLIRVLSVGTGQAVRLGERGDADMLLLNHRPSEDAIVAAGHGVAREEIMVNDFVVVGPAEDPAGIIGALTAAEAFRLIGRAEGPFVSRGDDSGTHLKEQALWRVSGVDGPAASGAWYRSAGSGMGAALNLAAAVGAYTLADRATWESFANKAGLALLFEGDPTLVNQYTAILVDPRRHPHVRATEAKTFVVWLTSEEGQRAIADFQVHGRQLYEPNAQPPDS